MEAQTTTMLSLQQEIDGLLQARADDEERGSRRAEEDAKIIATLNDQIGLMQSERRADIGIVCQLRLSVLTRLLFNQLIG